MRKIGGVLLIVIGVILILFASLRAVGIFIIFLGGEQTAYGFGFITGTVVFVILFIALGIKTIKKGRTLFAAKETNEPEPE